MGFLDVLFGSGPSSEEHVLDTLTPEQETALNSLLQELGVPREQFENNFGGQDDLSSLSLEGLEERARLLADPNRGSNLNAQASETLMKFLDFESADAGIEDFFQTNIRDPALEEFQRNILPAISRDFGGANFFSSERQGSDARAQDTLIDSLTRSRSNLAFQSRESDRNRALSALGLAPSISGANTNELLALLQGGEGVKQSNFQRDFDTFLANQNVDANRINQLLAGINTQAIENVVTTDPGSSGLFGEVIGAAGSVLGGPIGGAIASRIAGGGTSGTPTNSTSVAKQGQQHHG